MVDFGLFAFHCAARLVERGRSAQLYLPKLEHHLEARLWNDVLAWTEERLGLESGTFRATVLIETLPAAFQMDEILWELRTHAGGLNAGRWDYILSAIKCFRDSAEHVLPDRSEVTMTAPFMRAYTELLVCTCHRRGTFAMGGMAALIPSRSDPEANRRAVEAVRADKRREASDGFDGTWVAHPDLVSVAREEFDRHHGGRLHQIDRRRDDVDVGADQLLDLAATAGTITEAGMRNNVSVAFQYMSSWLCGRGAVAINGLMEDTATAEICRTQLWHWIRHRAQLDDGQTVTAELVSRILDDETARIRASVGESTWQQGRPAETRQLFEQVTLGESLIEFITQPGYELID